jgi:glycosyltransferase involved in cell wall biosynthesis
MLVAVDCTTLRGPLSGVGYYTARLVEHLGRIAGEPGSPVTRLVLLSNRVIERRLPPRAEVVEGLRFPVRSIWMQFLLPLLLARRRPALCHFTNYLGPAITRAPYVVSIHDMSLSRVPEHHTFKKRILTSSLIPRIARRARLVLTPSESARSHVLGDLGLAPERVESIPYAPAEHFRPTDERPRVLDASIPYILFVGTIEPRKNLMRGLEAFARAAADRPGLRFVLAGQRGWKCDDVYRRAGAADLRGRVVLLDYVPEEELPRLYSHALACFYPSLFEGFGFPVVEAMACGTPVVTSETTSLGEMGAGAAVLVDPLDVEGMARAIEKLVGSPETRATLRARGLRRAAEFSWTRTVERTVAAYTRAARIH